MKIPGVQYLVGGAVRDIQMGRPPSDRDYVVVGATAEEMIAAGFSQVGADFPVFLHPKTRDEYALARTERKTGFGYKGFTTIFSPDVTLEDDLIRRDLTCNSMAMDADGNLIDPFNGMVDIQNSVLRATSEAFREDPLRVLRIARFAAKLNFEVDPDTVTMCMEISKSDEFRNLTPERVGNELLKVLGSQHPDKFFRVLKDVGALEIHFPEIHALIGQTQPVLHHPEGDAFLHVMAVLRESVKENLSDLERFCALTHDLGKGVTPKEVLPKHHGHEAAGVPLVEAMVDRLRLSSDHMKAGKIVARFHTHVHRIFEMSEKTIVRLFEDLGSHQSGEMATILANVSMCDAHGRGEFLAMKPYPNRDHFVAIMDALASVKARDIIPPADLKNMTPVIIKDALHRARLTKIKEFKK